MQLLHAPCMVAVWFVAAACLLAGLWLQTLMAPTWRAPEAERLAKAHELLAGAAKPKLENLEKLLVGGGMGAGGGGAGARCSARLHDVGGGRGGEAHRLPCTACGLRPVPCHDG